MSGHLGIDFGTSNTVLALWNDKTSQGVPLHIPDFGLTYEQNGEILSVIPSLVHYTEDNRIWIGNQVIERDLAESPHTLRWMKRYISSRSPMKIKINGKEITPYQAGQDFLTGVLVFTAQEISHQGEEVGLSVPVEAFEHYENWLTGVAEKAGMPRFRLIDEPSAAALGYGANIQPGHVYLIFDFGGGTMHASVILIEAEEKAVTGRRCRVLGKAGRNIGGTIIDQWLFQEVLRQNRCQDSDMKVRAVSTRLLLACQHAKELLSNGSEAEIRVDDPTNGFSLEAAFSRTDFEELLDKHELFTSINQMIRSALVGAVERGYREEDIQAVLMVGGSSQIPAVQRVLRQQFGRDRVFHNRPLDAVARGAAAFVAGVDFYDHIQHDYGIRFINPQKNQYDYRVIVQRGTPYPNREPFPLVIKASYDQQEQLGIAIFELSEKNQPGDFLTELVFDPSGAARITQVTAHDLEQRSHFWMNEHNPTFLIANPPALQGEARFEVEFTVDSNKRLLITARDAKNDRQVYKDFPVVKLT